MSVKAVRKPIETKNCFYIQRIKLHLKSAKPTDGLFTYKGESMTREEAKRRMEICRDFLANNYSDMGEPNFTAFEMAIKTLSQEPCADAVSRQDALNCLNGTWGDYSVLNEVYERISKLPSVTQKSGKCKNCKYFEYDSVAKVDEIPLIVAHEICNKWGNGCKTSEDGYCYLFEPQESEG